MAQRIYLSSLEQTEEFKYPVWEPLHSSYPDAFVCKSCGCLTTEAEFLREVKDTHFVPSWFRGGCDTAFKYGLDHKIHVKGQKIDTRDSWANVERKLVEEGNGGTVYYLPYKCQPKLDRESAERRKQEQQAMGDVLKEKIDGETWNLNRSKNEKQRIKKSYFGFHNLVAKTDKARSDAINSQLSRLNK